MNQNQNMTGKAARPAPWSAEEDRAIVRDYLDMMAALGRAERINKAATRRALMPKLNGRSEASVEFKRCNVSAVLAEMGRGWLPGYRPAYNYQRGLVDTVRAELAARESAAA
jgi:hypothetical protein